MLTYLVATFVFPVLGWAANAVYRKQIFGQFPISTVGDWLLLLVVFDATAILLFSDLAKMVRWPMFQAHLPGVFGGLAGTTLFAFIIAVGTCERTINEARETLAKSKKSVTARQLIFDPAAKLQRRAIFSWVVSLILFAAATAAHIMIFVWDGPPN